MEISTNLMIEATPLLKASPKSSHCVANCQTQLPRHHIRYYFCPKVVEKKTETRALGIQNINL